MDFKFIEIPNLEQWVISAPKRSKRPKQGKSKLPICPFCPGHERKEKEVYRIGGEDHDANWQVRVIPNKFPFAPIHEIVIHNPKHGKTFTNSSIEEVRLVIETFVNRYNTHYKIGSVCIFNNSGKRAGESIGHSHSQIAVVPKDVQIVVPKLEFNLDYWGEHFDVGEFTVMCPPYSQWPDEVWVVPKDRRRLFGEIRYEEMENLAFILKRLVRIFGLRHGDDYPYNFYIYPFHDWYLRIMPRAKTPGGFEIATGIFVNTQNPKETMSFIKEHFYDEEEESIRKNKARYRRGV